MHVVARGISTWSHTSEVTKGIAAVDFSRNTVAMVASGLAIKITASPQPRYPIRGAASAAGSMAAVAALAAMTRPPPNRVGAGNVGAWATKALV